MLSTKGSRGEALPDIIIVIIAAISYCRCRW